MMKEPKLVSVESTITKRWELTGDELIDLLGIEPGVVGKLEIFVKVPSGGDYSNMKLEIDKVCPIVITSVYNQIEEIG